MGHPKKQRRKRRNKAGLATHDGSGRATPSRPPPQRQTSSAHGSPMGEPATHHGPAYRGELPGFYYDPARDKYFRGKREDHSAAPSCPTPPSSSSVHAHRRGTTLPPAMSPGVLGRLQRGTLTPRLWRSRWRREQLQRVAKGPGCQAEAPDAWAVHHLSRPLDGSGKAFAAQDGSCFVTVSAGDERSFPFRTCAQITRYSLGCPTSVSWPASAAASHTMRNVMQSRQASREYRRRAHTASANNSLRLFAQEARNPWGVEVAPAGTFQRPVGRSRSSRSVPRMTACGASEDCRSLAMYWDSGCLDHVVLPADHGRRHGHQSVDETSAAIMVPKGQGRAVVVRLPIFSRAAKGALLRAPLRQHHTRLSC